MGPKMSPSRENAPSAKRSSKSPVDPSAAPTIGVDMGGTKIALAVVTPTGEVLDSHRHPTDTSGGVERIVDTISSCVRDCLGDSASRAVALGAGVAAQIRQKDGVLLAAPNLPWRNVPFRAMIQDAVGLPTAITNDVRAATLGEWRFGAGKGERDIVCVFVGTGVGGGIVADGRLRHGATDTAGELGHLTIVVDGRSCHCPNSGCLEAYAGGWAIAERAQELAKARPSDSGRVRELAGGIGKITAETIAEAYRGGDPFSQEILESTVEYLAAGLVGVVNAFNPRVLILGGGIIDGLPQLVPAVEALIRQRAIEAALGPLKVVHAGLGENAGVLGAAEMARGLLPHGRTR